MLCIGIYKTWHSNEVIWTGDLVAEGLKIAGSWIEKITAEMATVGNNPLTNIVQTYQ